jgi:hypothetical protein
MTIEELTALFNGRGRAIYEAHCHIVQLTDSLAAVTRERDEARAEVQRLTDERDELLVRVADQGAELRATREAYIDAKWTNAYRRGAEAMLDACVATIHGGGLVWTRESAERALREIGIEP